uniref:Mechanosensitive ion channel protein n=1 Tax=Alexandrium monilatum TaxID=311494 RepID=A0A7S4Q3J3_9DINO
MGSALLRPGAASDASPGGATGRGGIAGGGASIRELWAEQNPYSGWAASGRQSTFHLVLPRQQIRRDQIEAHRVARLFEYLEHIDDELPLVAGGAAAKAPPHRRLCKGALLPGLLLAFVAAYLPRLEYLWPYHCRLFDFDSTLFLTHTAAGLLTYAAMGPALRLLSSLVLRLARVQGSRATAQAVYVNAILLREERVACSVFCAWAVNFSWWTCLDQTRKLLWPPCLAVLLLILTNGLRKLLEFAFLTRRLRSRFQSDVLSNAFEQAALQRLVTVARECSEGQPPSEVLRSTPVVPDICEPHAFERHTAEMLKVAFGLQDGLAKAAGRRSVFPSYAQTYAGDARGAAKGSGLAPIHREPPAVGFRTPSTTMFVMQREGSCSSSEIEEEARYVFQQILSRPWSDVHGTDFDTPAGCGLVFSDLRQAMTAEDANRTWQLLAHRAGNGRRSEVEEGASISVQDFVQAVLGSFERFHMLAATVKDYAAIWLVFSSVLAAVQVAIAVGIILGIFFPPGFLRTVCITVPTAFLGLSFVFGSLLREVFESLVLILLVQPYDVGDRISLPDGEESYQTFTVQKLNILTTEARDSLNQCVYLKNSALFQESRLVNLGRSLNAVVELSFEMSASQLSGEIVGDLETFIRRYIAGQAANWVPTYLRSFTPVESGHAHCDLSGAVTHRFRLMHRRPWQDIREIRNDATSVLYAVLEEMRRIGIDFRLSSQPVHLEGLGLEQDKLRPTPGRTTLSGRSFGQQAGAIYGRQPSV